MTSRCRVRYDVCSDLVAKAISKSKRFKKMKALPIIAALIALLGSPGYPSEIASVNFKALKEPLMAYYFSDPENAEMEKRFKAAASEEEKVQEEIQRSLVEGKGPLDFQALGSKMGAQGIYEMERQIEADLRKELYRIVSGLGLEFDFIFDSSELDSVIFAKRSVQDLTTLVKQAIFDLQAKKRPEPAQSEATEAVSGAKK